MFEGHDIRIVNRDGTPWDSDSGGKPWWVALDVCDAVGIENNRDAVSKLDADEKANVSISDGRRAALELLVLKLGIEPFEKLLKARDIRASIVEAGGGAVIGARGPIDFSVYHRFSKR
jgi:hypothetical protein